MLNRLTEGICVKDICPGQEARSLKIIRSKSNETYVVKEIDEARAFEEVSLMVKSNKEKKGIYPEVINLNLGDNASYTMSYVKGESLQEYFHKLSNPLEDEELNKFIMRSINKIKQLHTASLDSYTSGYHETIVYRRLKIILDCPIIQNHIRLKLDIQNFDYYSLKNFSININNLTLQPSKIVYKKASNLYSKNLPMKESLIHGDPHLGNIMYDYLTLNICFIDPRSTWDTVENKKNGYFDPLYDVAAICHSLIANDNLRRINKNRVDFESGKILITEDTMTLFNYYYSKCITVLREYLSRDPNKDEFVRFIVYLACSLSGTMRYSIWAPDISKLLSNYIYSYLLLLKIVEDENV